LRRRSSSGGRTAVETTLRHCRAEHFRDPESGNSGAGPTFREGTVTYELRPREQLILKVETRCDRSTDGVFFTATATRTGSSSLSPVPSSTF
jgi:hypothetical protein